MAVELIRNTGCGTSNGTDSKGLFQNETGRGREGEREREGGDGNVENESYFPKTKMNKTR